jgi:hypothetical protein
MTGNVVMLLPLKGTVAVGIKVPLSKTTSIDSLKPVIYQSIANSITRKFEK